MSESQAIRTLAAGMKAGTEETYGWDTHAWWRLDSATGKWEPVQEADVPAYLVNGRDEHEVFKARFPSDD